MKKYPVQSLLKEFKAGLQPLYGSRLRGFYLYGSYARGEQGPESDMDVLIVLDHFDHYSTEINRTSWLSSSLSLKYGISISRVFLRERDWFQSDTPFLTNVREEAVAS